MRIRFDLDFDGYPWPGPLRKAEAAFGEQWVGPCGLLGLLETQLGLGGVDVPEALRSVALVPPMLATKGFWTASAQADLLGVADTLLRWRDTLWESGWRGQPISPRLKELSQLMAGVQPGMPDRLSAVAAALVEGAITDLRTLELNEKRAGYSQAWRSVFDSLEKCGTKVVEIDTPVTEARGDLLQCQRSPFTPTADGTLQLLRPLGPQQAAEHAAAWLASRKDHGRTVIVSPDPLFDATLRRHGLPTVGAASNRNDLSLLEILPLVIQIGWSPSDPNRALELLTLPSSPVPKGIRGQLLGALQEWPAIDSDAWRTARSQGLERIEDADERDRLDKRLGVLLRANVKSAQYPVSELRDRTTTLTKWFHGMTSFGDADLPAYQAAIAQCGHFLRLVELVGLAAFSRPQLDKLLDAATAQVAAHPRFPSQAGLLGVPTPGAIGGVADQIVWWNFTRESAPRPHVLPLTLEEKKALASAGVELPQASELALALNARWSRPLRFARSNLLLVCPQRGIDGEDQHPHPLWDEIVANTSPAAPRDRLVVQAPMFDAEPTRRKHVLLPTPQPRREWRLPKGVTIPSREKESPSGAGSLVGCPFQWTLRYAGGIRGGDTAELPANEQLMGSVAHEILARVLKSKPANPEAAGVEAERLFDAEGPRLAAPLFMPGSEKLKQESRRATARAARALVKYLVDAKLSLVDVEQDYTRRALGGEFEGRTDLVVGPPEVVIDLKWSGENYRRSELEAGAAYQLASYSFLVGTNGRWPPVAYFILRSQQMLTTHGGLFEHHEHLQGASPDATWKAFETCYHERRKELDSGLILATGEVDADGKRQPEKSQLADDCLLLTPPCQFCSFGLLCGHGLPTKSVPAGLITRAP